jgi:hypothetical protein
MKTWRKVFGYFLALIVTLIWCASAVDLVDTRVGTYIMVFIPTFILFGGISWVITSDKSIH